MIMLFQVWSISGELSGLPPKELAASFKFACQLFLRTYVDTRVLITVLCTYVHTYICIIIIVVCMLTLAVQNCAYAFAEN